MKKILLASTALIAFGAVSAQAAEPVKLSIGGYLQQVIAYADNRDELNQVKFDQQGFGQVNFVGSTKLDNGLTVAVQVETYASQLNHSRTAAGAIGARGVTDANSNVRRAYLSVSSAYGQLILGQREDYAFISGVYAPDVGWGMQGGDWGNYLSNPSNHAGYFDSNNSRYSATSEKITLISPSFAGFSVGATYTPDVHQGSAGDLAEGSAADNLGGNTGAGAVNRTNFAGDAYTVGAAYANTLGGVGVKGNVGFTQFNIANLRTYQAGLQTSYAGFTLGGALFLRDNDSDTLNNGTVATPALVSAAAATRAGLNWEVGASYATGPYSVSLSYFHDTSKRTTAFNGGTSGAADSTQLIGLSGQYILGPGVQWRNTLYYVDYKNNGGQSTAAFENDGVAVITGLRVNF